MRRNFFDDLKILAFVLNPIWKTVLTLKERKVTLGNSFFHLVQLNAAIKKLPRKDNISFYNYCIIKINKQFQEFNDDKYLLCFFLNPNFWSKYIFIKLIIIICI